MCMSKCLHFYQHYIIQIAMKLLLKKVLIFTVAVSFFASCRKKAFDEYYGRPDGLAQPIYQQLQQKGNFTKLLACIDKAGYKEILSGAGFWTFFAANDNAFDQFLRDRGLTSINQLDSATARGIVTYNLVYNAFAKARIGDYQSSAGWVPNQAFRRRTANYIGFYDDTTFAGSVVKTISANRNGGFVLGDNNNKYIPYFIENFMSRRGLTASDYNYFYPNSTYSGFNVANASVVTADIVAENGYIHEIDKVITPLTSIEQYLASNPEFSEFKKLYDKYMVTFSQNNEATRRYFNITGKNDNVFVKLYNASLAFSLGNENYVKLQDNDGQTESWTLFAPRNQAFIRYRDSVLLEHYPSLDAVPQQIIIDFLNAHMWQSAVWPSKFNVTNNFQAEPARFNPNTDVFDKKILSNGNFYGTNKVQLANVFSTVYGKPYLDPKYLLMTRALDQNIRFQITVPTVRYTMFMMSDQLLRSKGFEFNTLQNAWQYTTPNTTTVTIGNAARDMLQRILATHIVITPNNELNDLRDSGIVETLNGEYIKYKNGRLISAGIEESTTDVMNAGTAKEASNGIVYYSDNLLTYSNTRIGRRISDLGLATTSPFYNFAQYLRSSSIYNATTGDILGVQLGVFYTAFIPDNAAVLAAVSAGLLPRNTNGTPNFAPTSQAERQQVADFIQYHLINKTTIVNDGKKNGTFVTVYKKLSGEEGQLQIANAPQNLRVTDNFNRTANVINAQSNRLADRCVIHLINNYLRYNPN